MNTIRATKSEDLNQLDLNFDDSRLTEMLFRYRARNYPETLAEIEQKIWNKYRKDKFTLKANGYKLSINEYLNNLNELLNNSGLTEQQKKTLIDLKEYATNIKNNLNLT